MLIRYHEMLEKGQLPQIFRYVEDVEKDEKKDMSRRGAFALGTRLRFVLRVPRCLGAAGVVLRLARDGEDPADYPLSFITSDGTTDDYVYLLELSEELCGARDGLLYYEFLFLRGYDTLFTDSVNNVDFTLSDHNGNRFRLFVYDSDFRVPEWFAGGTMYHIFVDRFCRGTGKVGSRDDAVINPDWDNGIPEFADEQGQPLKNNEFFGGNLWGVAEKLPYLHSLGVTVIYLSPIFRAYSNHKYDTGDYMRIDEMFGGEEAFLHLLSEAKNYGIRVILDGVFNHTGDDSRYFNRYGKYDSVGAYQSETSEYRDWYCFRQFPDRYESWWGIEILPKLNPACGVCRDFLAGKDGVADKYIRMGIGGWRLDVADELSDEFLDELRTTVKSSSGDEGILIGEVWENAADKTAYGKRRRYFRGKQLDSVMNYPLRNAILSFVLDGDAEMFYNVLTDLYSSYPPAVCDALMNLLGTHDTERILSRLGKAPLDEMSNREMAVYRMTPSERAEAVRLLRLASALQYTVFGVPSVFYGDETGLEGGHDPFCRMPYPWGREDASLVAHYRALGKMRRDHPVLSHGEFRFLCHRDAFLAFERSDNNERILILANNGNDEMIWKQGETVADLLSCAEYRGNIAVPPHTALILEVV